MELKRRGRKRMKTERKEGTKKTTKRKIIRRRRYKNKIFFRLCTHNISNKFVVIGDEDTSHRADFLLEFCPASDSSCRPIRSEFPVARCLMTTLFPAAAAIAFRRRSYALNDICVTWATPEVGWSSVDEPTGSGRGHQPLAAPSRAPGSRPPARHECSPLAPGRSCRSGADLAGDGPDGSRRDGDDGYGALVGLQQT